MNRLEKTLVLGAVTGIVLAGATDEPYLDGFGLGMASMAIVDAVAYKGYELYCQITGRNNIFDRGVENE